MQRAYGWTLEGAILALAIALFPFYIFPSGGVQPSHLTFFLFALTTIYRYGIPSPSWGLPFLLLSGYSFLIEAIYGVIHDDLSHLITSAYFIFNLMLSISVYQAVLRNGTSAVRAGVFIATLFVVISVYANGVDLYEMGEEGRETGTFNNPNQLGYFSVCLLSFAYLLYLDKEIRFVTMLTLLASSVFLSIVSLSKAAILADFVVLAFTLRPWVRKRGVVVWLGLVFVVLGGGAYLLSIGYFDKFLFVNRLVNFGSERDSSLEERGYFALLHGSALQVFFGMGSPVVFKIVGHEVHSTFASVLNYYGILGFALLFSIVAIWGLTLYQAYGFAAMVAVIGPASLYGITHNGTRFSLFWLLFSASLGMVARESAAQFRIQRKSNRLLIQCRTRFSRCRGQDQSVDLWARSWSRGMSRSTGQHNPAIRGEARPVQSRCSSSGASSDGRNLITIRLGSNHSRLSLSGKSSSLRSTPGSPARC